MALTQGLTNSFLREILVGEHDFTASTGNTFKIALYTSDAELNASTTAYSATNEVSGTGYSAGGATLTNVTPALDGNTAYVDFSDVTWSGSTITARGALIYNSTNSNKAVMVLDFGSDKSSTASDFTIQFPAADGTSGIIRLGH